MGTGGAGGSAGSTGGTSGGGAGGEAGANGGAGGQTAPDVGPGPAEVGVGGAGGTSDVAGPVPAEGMTFPGHPALVSIFDGKTMAGWDGAASVWSAKDGVMTGGGQRGQATTQKSYGSFRFVVTMRLSAGNDHLGICLWGTKRVFDCLLVVPPSGAIYDYVTNKTERAIQFDPEAKRTFHRTEVLANLQTGVVKVAVDGVARPDYKDPLFARRKAGPIGLQLHSGGIKVEFKEMFAEENPKEDRLITLK